MEGVKPKHIAIIPDGNRRWGELHGMGRQEAYAKGIDHIGDVLKWCKDEDIQILTMWGFSTDNFTRDKDEIGGLFQLFKSNLKKVIEENRGDERKNEVRVRFIGRTHLFPIEFQEMMRLAEAETKGSAKYQLNLLLAYGGREEIVDAVNAALKSGVKSVDEKSFSDLLYTKEIPDPDLIIRTSGEKRLSGLFPWQSTYSEFYFSDKLWPDFSREDFNSALEDYAKRRRRFGR